MAISFELEVDAGASADRVFRTMADVRRWATFPGVAVVGPERPIAIGDRLDVSLRLMRRDIRMGCVANAVTRPTEAEPGYVDLRSVAGPFDARLSGYVTSTGPGCHIEIDMHGVGRGPARILEGAVDYAMQRWATWQLRHLLALAAEEPELVTP